MSKQKLFSLQTQDESRWPRKAYFFEFHSPCGDLCGFQSRLAFSSVLGEAVVHCGFYTMDKFFLLFDGQFTWANSDIFWGFLQPVNHLCWIIHCRVKVKNKKSSACYECCFQGHCYILFGCCSSCQSRRMTVPLLLCTTRSSAMRPESVPGVCWQKVHDGTIEGFAEIVLMESTPVVAVVKVVMHIAHFWASCYVIFKKLKGVLKYWHKILKVRICGIDLCGHTVTHMYKISMANID